MIGLRRFRGGSKQKERGPKSWDISTVPSPFFQAILQTPYQILTDSHLLKTHSLTPPLQPTLYPRPLLRIEQSNTDINQIWPLFTMPEYCSAAATTKLPLNAF